MINLLQQYAGYNSWANKTLLDKIANLNDEQIHQDMVSSFTSLYKTVLHMWQAEHVWWQRLNRIEDIVFLTESFRGSFQELVAGFAAQDLQWKQWMDNAGQEQLEESFSFIRNNEPFTMVLHDMILHVFNHATFHRGQLVTLLRQLGETVIPSTDFTTFTRIKNRP
jgi:uncharacterized damage-inducible protein DinB